MHRVSVVIITLNEENNIAECVRSAGQITDDIIVVDSGSDDLTVQLARENGAKVFTTDWQGYGHSRNWGASHARENWIVSLDADERITPELAASINAIAFTRPDMLYKFRRENYIGNKKIRFGTPGFETVTRIYNRNFCQWDLTLVHEKLVAPGAIKKTIAGKMLHYSHKNYDDYKTKSALYAQMSAEKYAMEGRKVGFAKKIFSPVFNSLKSYVFQLGFLDGRMGAQIALNIASYSWMKYFYLQQLYTDNTPERQNFSSTRRVETASS